MEDDSTDLTQDYSSNGNLMINNNHEGVDKYLNFDDNNNNNQELLQKFEEEYNPNQDYINVNNANNQQLQFQPIQQPIMNHQGYMISNPNYLSLDKLKMAKLTQQIDKSKRIQKREKAKNRKQLQEMQQQQQQQQQISQNMVKIEEMSSAHESLEGNKSTSQSNLLGSPQESKQQKKMQQMIRNRISAQNSRDRKKAYINHLEAQNRDLALKHQNLQSKYESVVKENQQIRGHNLELKKEISMLREKYQEPQQKENLFEDPFPSNQQTPRAKQNFTVLGLTLLSIVGICMFMGPLGVTKNEQTSSLILAQKPSLAEGLVERGTNAQLELESIGFQKLDETSNEFIMLKKVDKVLEEDKSAIKNIIEDERKQATENQKIKVEKFLAIAENSQENCSNGLAPLHAVTTPVQTIFCPSPYKLQNDLFVNTKSVNFKDNEWIQLIVPKNEVKLFNTDFNDNIFVGQNNVTDSSSSSELLEIWAKIQSVREYTSVNSLTI